MNENEKENHKPFSSIAMLAVLANTNRRCNQMYCPSVCMEVGIKINIMKYEVFVLNRIPMYVRLNTEHNENI